LSGTFITVVLFLFNYLVFQNLVDRSEISPVFTFPHAGRVLSSPASLQRIDLNPESLSEFRKQAHIRTLVFQNFREFPRKERSELFQVIYNQSREMGIDPYVTLSIIATESSFRKKAISWAGAYGLMQIKPITAEEVADEIGIPWRGERTLFDPVVNITLGLRYLAKLKKRFGNLSDALTAYNYGPQYVVSCLKRDRRLPDKYIEKIKRNLRRYGLNNHEIAGLNRKA